MNNKKNAQSYVDLANLIESALADGEELRKKWEIINAVKRNLREGGAHVGSLLIWCPVCIHWNKGKPECDYHTIPDLEPPDGMPSCFNSDE